MSKKESKTADREITISREFNAPIELVWEVWTNPDHIKNWWGPNGFTNTIHSMQVEKEGEWTLTMHGPDGTNYKNKSIFKQVVKHKKLVYEHVSGPKFLATINFETRGNKTFITWNMLFPTKEIFIQTVKTFGADEGLKQNVEKLNHYLNTQLLLRKQLKTNNIARVTTYLNFPGNTEEAMHFYKEVFNGEFVGPMQRFGDLSQFDGAPPVAEADKKLIIHSELSILGGHILMATDAPESMGFTLTTGNNMNINVEPTTRKETKRIFEALSSKGKITMELQDMFWGAYFGSCIDKYGINWMVNCNAKK